MSFPGAAHRRAFSLIELVIVVVILGIIAAIAIPRMSRGAAGASDSAVRSNLAIMRSAIDLFSAEHTGTFPGATVATQLTQYTNAAGAVSATKTAAFIYGPYLREVPGLPVGVNRGLTTFNVVTGAGTAYTYTAAFGWWYNSDTGVVKAMTDAGEVDASGTLYSAY